MKKKPLKFKTHQQRAAYVRSLGITRILEVKVISVAHHYTRLIGIKSGGAVELTPLYRDMTLWDSEPRATKWVYLIPSSRKYNNAADALRWMGISISRYIHEYAHRNIELKTASAIGQVAGYHAGLNRIRSIRDRVLYALKIRDSGAVSTYKLVGLDRDSSCTIDFTEAVYVLTDLTMVRRGIIATGVDAIQSALKKFGIRVIEVDDSIVRGV